MPISVRLSKRVVAVEVSKPDHGVQGGGEYEGEVGGKESCEHSGGIIVSTVIV